MDDPPPIRRAARLGLDVELRAVHSGGRRWPAHWHADLQLIATLEGEAVARAGSRQFAATRGSVLVLPPGVAHTAWPTAADWTFLSLHIAPERLGDLAAGAFMPAVLPADAPVSRAFHALVASLFRRSAGDPPLAQLTTALRQAVQADTPQAPTWLLSAKARLESDLGGATSLEALAQELDVGRRRLERRFRTAFGLSPGAWRSCARVEAAKASLRGGAGASEAAFAAGMPNPAGLSRTFRRLTGLSPRRYAQGCGRAEPQGR